MLKISLLLVIVLASFQASPTSFYVRVEALTDYDSRYIFYRSNQIIPQDRRVHEGDIKDAVQCLVDDLKATGMFANVTTSLVKTSDDDVRKLEINTTYQRGFPRFIISEISLDKMPQVDALKFQAALKKRGLVPGIRLLQHYYSGLDEKINESVAEAASGSASGDLHPRITIRPAGTEKVKILISPEYLACGKFNTSN